MNSEALIVKQTSQEPDFCYPIFFEQDFSRLADALRDCHLDGRKLCIISDSNVAPLYGAAVQEALLPVSESVSLYTFSAGESHKNLETIQEMYAFLLQNILDRKSLLVALGGGVTGDMTRFCAATYLRGIDFIQIPTTLLSQVDSSVGGKTGVDFQQYKNMVGAFHQPRLVYMNLSVLQTLPEAEFSCGMGEVLKTGLICDRPFFESVCAHSEAVLARDFDALYRMIRRCCEIKAQIVERDPKEQGERALLNLGHTVGHAVEKLKNFELLHGQCVGLGLIVAAAISEHRGMLTPRDTARIREGCVLYGLPRTVSGLTEDAVLAASRKDKKMTHGQIRFVLLRAPGEAYVDETVSDQEIREAIREILV